MTHLSEDTIERYLLHQIAGERELAPVEEHMLACAECTGQASRLTRIIQGLRAAMRVQSPEYRPPDAIGLEGGIVHLPEAFRRVAELANTAGREGFEVADVDYGIDVAEARRLLSEAASDDVRIPVRVQITYRRPE